LGEGGWGGEGCRVKILDFGLARAVGAEAQITQQGAIIGTPAYMAPEQGQGKRVDHRSDLFSLGCVLYRMATGEPAFQGTDFVSTLMAVATATPRPPRELEPALPKALSDLILRLLARDPADRPSSAHAVAQTLAHIAEDLARPAAAVRSRRWWPAAGIAAALAAVLIGLWAGGVIRLRSPDGILVVEVNEPNPDVFVDGDRMTVAWDKGGKKATIRIKPGTRKVEVKKEGFTVHGEEVEVKDGERHIFTARLQRDTPQAPPKKTTAALLSPPNSSPALAALRRETISPEALAAAGDGDPKRAPASLVGVLGEPNPLQELVIRSLAFSPDGRSLASACYDRTILVRDTATGRVQRVLKGHTSYVMSVAFSKDGRTLVSASHDGTLKLWPMDRPAPPQTLQPNLGEIWGMAVSADGRYLAAGGTTGIVRLWKWGQWSKPLDLPAAAGKSWIHFNGNRNASLAFSPSGDLLAVARDESQPLTPIRLYQTADGKLAQTLPGDRGLSPTDLAFSRDGKHLASFVQDVGAFVWDLASGKHIAAFPSAQFGSVAFSKDGKTLAVAGLWHVVLYDVASQKRQRVLSAGHGNCFSIVFSPDGRLLAAGFTTGIVHVWSTTTWKEKYLQRGHLHFIRSLAITADGSTILSAGDDDTLRRWDLARPRSNQILHRFNADHLFGAVVAASHDGRSFALAVSGDSFCDGHPVMTLWDAVPTKERWHLPLAPRSTWPRRVRRKRGLSRCGTWPAGPRSIPGRTRP
jgi:WD40 repeat protein